MKVKCINDSNRPNDIPTSQWIKKNVVYHVTEAVRCNIQGGLLGFKLKEVNLDGCAPYQFYAANRFVPVEPAQVKQEVETEVLELV